MSTYINKFYSFLNCSKYLLFILLFFSLNSLFARHDAKMNSNNKLTNFINSIGLQMIHVKAGKSVSGGGIVC